MGFCDSSAASDSDDGSDRLGISVRVFVQRPYWVALNTRPLFSLYSVRWSQYLDGRHDDIGLGEPFTLTMVRGFGTIEKHHVQQVRFITE